MPLSSPKNALRKKWIRFNSNRLSSSPLMGRAVMFSVEATSQVASTWGDVSRLSQMEATSEVASINMFQNLIVLLL